MQYDHFSYKNCYQQGSWYSRALFIRDMIGKVSLLAFCSSLIHYKLFLLWVSMGL